MLEYIFSVHSLGFLEYLVLLFGLGIIVLFSIASLTLFLIKRLRGIAKTLSGFTALLVIVYASVLFGGDVLREARANELIEQAAPLISAINRYQQETGYYPMSLNQLVPTYIKGVPQLRFPHDQDDGTAAFGYKLKSGGYMLHFGLAGPPFGQHFFYTPSKEYPEWWEVGVFLLKKRIGDWGWYKKV